MTQGTNMTSCSLPVIGEAESYLCFGFCWMWGQLCSRLSGFYFSSFYIKENGKKGKKNKISTWHLHCYRNKQKKIRNWNNSCFLVVADTWAIPGKQVVRASYLCELQSSASKMPVLLTTFLSVKRSNVDIWFETWDLKDVNMFLKSGICLCFVE